jgi:hypothetical protein
MVKQRWRGPYIRLLKVFSTHHSIKGASGLILVHGIRVCEITIHFEINLTQVKFGLKM